MMRCSKRVLVRVKGADDWCGDELRFEPGSQAVHIRAYDLQNGHPAVIAETRIADSDDPPTHTYRDGFLSPLSGGYGEHRAFPLDVVPAQPVSAAVRVLILGLLAFLILFYFFR